MRSELERINQIIGEMLVLAKPQAVQKKPVDIREKIDEIMSLMRAQANMKNVEIIAEIAPGVPNVMAEENQLKQVFINVAKNAIEAMHGGGTLQIRIASDSDDVNITFQDEGCGVPQELLDRLGEPFYTTKEHGTGLGLLVSKKILAEHHGSLSLSSQLHKGTTVTIQLPIDPQRRTPS